MPSTWERLEREWPPPEAAPQPPAAGRYRSLRERASGLLAVCGIPAVGFSHFGLVVASIDDALERVAAFAGTPVSGIVTGWVEAYQVRVARFPVEETELELIEPRGESFFREHQRGFGSGLHHLSFQVEDIADALNRLAENGVQLIDREPRAGSHGRVAFSAPADLSPCLLEVWQSAGAH